MALDIRVVTPPEEMPLAHHTVTRLADYWREDGHRVAIGPAQEVCGDIAILHVDRTRVPDSLVPQNPSRIPLLNGAVLDISKRAISRHLLRPDDRYDGPVIVKTNDNYFGRPEARVRRRGLLRRVLRKALRWQFSRTLPDGSYPVLDHVARVPDWVWRREDVVVERFLPEMADGLFVLRLWTFFGRREHGTKLYGREPVVKASNCIRWEPLDGVPDSLRVERERLRFDFGKFDYVVRNGEAILLDANKTPTVLKARSSNLRNLANGLTDFLRSP